MANPLVTIITPTYNHDAYIRDCLQSTIDQTYRNWEQIVIDDGSTDRTRELVGACRDKRIRMVAQEHRGPYQLHDTYNAALEQAKGSFVAVLEGDDFWPPAKLDLQVHSMGGGEFVLSHGRYAKVDPSGSVTIIPPGLPENVARNSPIGAATRRLLTHGGLSHSSTLVIRRNALEAIGGFQSGAGLPFVDVPTLLHLSLKGGFAYAKEIVGYHRYSRDCITFSADDWNDALLVYKLKFLESAPGYTIGIRADEITEAHARAKAGRLIFRGRIAMIQKQWGTANRLFRSAAESPSWPQKGVSVLGLLSSATHANVLELLWGTAKGYRLRNYLE